MGFEQESVGASAGEKDLENGSGHSPVETQIAEAPLLHRKLKSRHMQMIAIGGSIGAGLFVGSGSSLASGGPASLVIGFIIIGIMLLFTVNALGELAALYPIGMFFFILLRVVINMMLIHFLEGAFYNYSIRFIDPSWGFAMGWK